MRNFFWSCCIVSIGILLAPCSSFALDAPHFKSYSPDFSCYSCHVGHTGGAWLPSAPECTDCHSNATGSDYSDDSAPKMANHSSEVIGSSKYDSWERMCLDCHEQHLHNRNPGSNNLVEIVPASYTTVDHVTTLTLDSITILDPDWADPATWGSKTGPERGLILERILTWAPNFIYTYEILSATANTITVRNGKDDKFPTSSAPETLYIKYGMYIAEEVDGETVIFSSPSSMANDESGDGTDETPDGICQVCHTQTTHWRSDGSFANHFNGWNCVLCHPHEEGFKANPPPLCP